MKPIRFVALLSVSWVLVSCAGGPAGTGKIGPDYEANRTYQTNRVQEMHSSLQRGTF
ncbi:MAG: hypothetical protein JNK37_08665 [Verrucomicrobiales bacterium]|nr:hypothetical protein [Verrucomicrobiales bacterium]